MREFQVTDADRARFESFVYPEPNSGCLLFVAAPSVEYGSFQLRSAAHIRVGTRGENNAERDRKGRSGKSRKGFPQGVERIPSGRFRARFCDNHERRPRHLGTFDTPEEAEAAVKAARLAWRGY